MANTTEFLSNEYMVFEADQVLTNDHLNQMFNYLDQQNRWTRNKLIGIGIVCGLNIVQHTGVVEVTKGCGVTSQGYLIVLDDKQYSYYLPYSAIPQPNDLPFTYPNNALPFYQTYCTGKTIYYLLTDDDYNALEAGAKSNALLISDANANNLLTDFVLVLFLEAAEMDLKNCDVFDCNNKGEKMLFNIRALLVKSGDLPQLPQPTTTPVNVNTGKTKPSFTNIRTTSFASEIMAKTNVTANTGNIKTNSGLGLTDTGLLHLQPLALGAPQINLKRFNVPYTDIKSTDDLINAFVKLVDDTTLSSVADAYNYCYNQYQSLLDNTATGFPTLLNDLKTERDNILKNYPLFIQYFYDFIDDLLKAYDEFKLKISQLLYACCPDENLFPLHLVLGSATGNTKGFVEDAYRTYFMYSPLFAKGEDGTSETRFLFRRMQILVSKFITVNSSNTQSPNISVLPSLYQQALLSQRAIPYYYTVNDAGNELYNYWNYYKTARGLATQNLNYNASQYSSDVAVLNPLLYDIEKNNFFRIEGHIGINYQTVLSNISQQQKNFNLPFDIVAISADQLPTNSGTLPQCSMQDLDTDYQLLLSEFSCKVHTPFCYITKLAYPPQTASTTGTITNIGNTTNTGNIEGQLAQPKDANVNLAPTQIPFTTFRLQAALNPILIHLPILNLGYRKGDFMRKYCAPNANTIGSVYLASLNSAGVFTNPVQLSSQNLGLIQYYYLFDYVDAVESLMQVLSPQTLATIDMNAFATAYQRFANTLNLVTFSVTELLNTQLGNSDNTTLQFFKTIRIDELINEMSAPVYDCIDERLQTLQNEYTKRLQQYQTQLSFYSYYNKHYGLEHKAGVPKGGTFVLVYHPASQTTTASGTTAGTVGNVSSVLLQNVNALRTNEATTEAKLFTAKAPKASPEKNAAKPKKISSKADVPTGTAMGGIANHPTNQPVNTVTEQPVSIANQPSSGSVSTGHGTQNPVLTQQPVNTVTNGIASTNNTLSLLDQNTLDLIKKFANSSANLTAENRQSILGFLNQASLQLVSSQYAVADNVVVADFYIPYLCCSDCPPVAYILPAQQTTPVFSIAGNQYVFTDTNNYPFTTTPPVSNTNVAQDPFTSSVVTNSSNLHLLTDGNNTLFLQPAMPNLTATLTVSLSYHNIPLSITIIKPDATFVINKITDAAGIPSLQLQPSDAAADAYTWTVNGLPNIFDNIKSPTPIPIQDLKNKTQSSTFNIQLTMSYTRNNVTASDTKTQTFQTGVCIDFESFELNTVFGVQAGQKEGDVAFTTGEKIVARVWQFLFPQDSTFGDAVIVAVPQGFGAGQCLQMNNVDMEFDYSNSSIQPTQITVQFLMQGGNQNLSVNNSDMFIGPLTQTSAQIGNVQAAVKMVTDTMGTLTLTGTITTFKIGGQGLLIDNVCAQ